MGGGASLAQAPVRNVTAFGIRGLEGFWGSILVALLGAVILLALIRLLIPRPRRL